MQVDENHRLSGCNWRPSSHFDDRPSRQEIELIVLHCISLPRENLVMESGAVVFGYLEDRRRPLFF
ncbi:MAG: hypothetical protein Ct9H90mP27_7130 [Gammaproteobacteria bacterium]|nr:MAG: hypothetical protein Ct9H90mP27_7130 [Gammaproteobacteria bacterium]